MFSVSYTTALTVETRKLPALSKIHPICIRLEMHIKLNAHFFSSDINLQSKISVNEISPTGEIGTFFHLPPFKKEL